MTAQTAWAQSSVKVSDGLGAPRLSMKNPSATRASVFGQFRFESLQYMTTLPETPSLTTSQFLSGRITAASYSRDPLSLNWAADLSAGTFFSLKQSYYSVQEIYVSTPLDERASLSIGEKNMIGQKSIEFGLWDCGSLDMQSMRYGLKIKV